MLFKSFEIVIKDLCQNILQETDPNRLSENIINHVQKNFNVEWSTLWLTEQISPKGDLRLKIAAASEIAMPLLTAEKGKPAVYDFGEGLTGYIAQTKQTIIRSSPQDVQQSPHKGKYDKAMYGGEKEAMKQCHCVLGVPLLLRSSEAMGKAEGWRVIGVIKLENKKSMSGGEESFTKEDAGLLEGYAAIIAVALEKAQMRLDSIRIGQGLLGISHNLLEKLGERPDLNDIVEKTATVISAGACSLWLRHGMQLRLEAAYGYPGDTDNVPPYNLAIEYWEAKKVGLTVFVGKKKEQKPLNLKSMDAIKNHPNWRGANDERMWGKPKGEACYSLLAIPLIDNETKDVKGVFKIENKKKTIFQLENYFDEEDEKLLSTLGNSICSSLIISEHFEMLKRLEKLVSKIHVLGSLKEALFFILTGLTHGGGLKYNRAMIFLSEGEADKKELVCRFAIGPISENEWDTSTSESSSYGEKEFEDDLDDLLRSFQLKEQIIDKAPIMKKWLGRKISINDESQVLSHHFLKIRETRKYLSGALSYPDILNGFPHGDYVLIPMIQDKETLGIIYADNRFTGNPISSFECEVLDIFSGMAAAIIQISLTPEKIKKESEEAWRRFSQPAAHRLGTETNIIEGEINIFCRPELGALRGVIPQVNIKSLSEIESSLRIIESSTNRLRQATRDYQQLTPDPEEKKDFNLNGLIEEIVKKTIKDIRNLTVDWDIRGKPSFITAYQNRLTYVFEEIILNAIKEFDQPIKEFDQQPKNEKRIKIEIWHDSQNVLCRISDNGRGIPQNIVTKLFKEPVKGRKGGTGLGMFLIGRFIKENGGNIELSVKKPENYSGASFLMTLPLDQGGIK